MPSYPHEGIVHLFRCRPSLASDLLRSTRRAKLPRHTSVRVCAADLTELRPVEYRADLVVQLVDGDGRPVLGIIVEVQLSRDRKKKYVWPHYATSLGVRLECPVVVLVVTPNQSVAKWAAKPIDLDNGGAFIPRVIGPSDVPVIDDDRQAQANPELAVLSAIVHGRDPDVAKAARIAAVAIRACEGLDTERSGLFFDLIYKPLSEGARRVLQKMLPANYQYQSSFARKYYGQGLAKGQAQGREKGIRETLLTVVTKQLGQRFGHLGEVLLIRIAAASDAELESIAERVLSASSLEDALGAPENRVRTRSRSKRNSRAPAGR